MADAPLYAAFGVVGGALATAIASFSVAMYQNRSQLHREHRQRAFEQHLRHYESIFATARSTQQALRDLEAVRQRAVDAADPFMKQLLSIAADRADAYCVAVDWQHNPGMAYLDLKLEGQCLRARELLLDWLSVPRVTTGDIAHVRRNGAFAPLSLRGVRTMRRADYSELRIERRPVVLFDAADERRLEVIDRALTKVIKELKGVIAY